MAWYRRTSLLVVLLCFSTIFAQDNTCSAMVTQALTVVQEVCAPTGRNQACYGNISIQATPRADVANFSFEQQGDLVDVATVQTLRLRALDQAQNVWGVAMLKLQADLPDTLPGQNVTFLLFGDVQLENAVDPNATGALLQVTASSSVNILSQATANGAASGSLAGGEVTIANGRSAASDWLRVRIPETDSYGWVSAAAVSVAGDAGTLNVVDSLDSNIPFTPMQAFYFQTGVGGSSSLACTQAPADGMLIQTPQGVGHINLRANDVDIRLGSTAYVQATPNGQFTVNVLEGQGEVRAFGRTVLVPAGARVNIPVDENMQASGEPDDPEPYEESFFENLPVDILPEEIEIAEAIDEDELAALEADFEAELDARDDALFDDADDADFSADEEADLSDADSEDFGDAGGDDLGADTGGDFGGDAGGDTGGDFGGDGGGEG